MIDYLTTWGLDLGTNSLGWAIINTRGEPGAHDEGCLVDCGVRIFSQTEFAGREAPRGTPLPESLAKNRREKRGARRRRDRGLRAFAETCPQYLFLSYDNYEEPNFEGAKYVMSPPLRDRAKQDQLWRGLEFNDLQAVSTDHCPFCFKEADGKLLGKDDFSKIPNGAPGIETRMSLMFDGGPAAGRISLNRWVDLCSTSPAKIFGLFPRKGTLAPGSDADIVVFDPMAEQVLGVKSLHMNVDYNPYEGRRVRGVSETVLSRGEVVIENGQCVGRPGRGRFLKRRTRFENDALQKPEAPQAPQTPRSTGAPA